MEPVSAGSKRGIWGVFGAFSGRFGSVQFVCSHQERFTGIWLPDKAGLTQTARCSVSKPAQFLPSTSGLETFKIQFPKYFGLFAATRPCCRPQAFPAPPHRWKKHSWGAGGCISQALGSNFWVNFLTCACVCSATDGPRWESHFWEVKLGKERG